jgi:hypothetical protein
MNRTLPFLVVLALVACNDSGADKRPTTAADAPHPARTVLQFLENPAALDETWSRCRNDPGGIGQTPDCQNAGYAKERLMMLGRERAIESLKR